MKFQPIGPLLLLGTLSLTGCEEFYTVDDACSEKVVGGSFLGKTEEAAMLRMNCHRRLAGVTRASANERVQTAADGAVNYVLQNPNYQELLSDIGPVFWLTQENEKPGFTGISVYDRLTGDETTGGAGYTIYDVGGTGYWEFIAIDIADNPEDLKTGKQAIDELMRFPVFRQSALQPSWIDGAYAEADLSQQWFLEGGFDTQPAPTTTPSSTTTGTTTGTTGTTTPGTTVPVAPLPVPYGKVYYMVVLYQAPHFEHVDKPVLYPKEEQEGVPLYSWSQNRNRIVNGAYAPTQVGYPVTLTMGALDPTNYEPIDQNQYNAQITGASIVGDEGPLETEVVHPGDDAEDVWPSGQFQRTTLAIFTRHPLSPSTKYDVFVDLTTPEGTFEIDYWFRTVGEDPGLNPTLGLTPVEPAGTGRRVGQSGMPYYSSLTTPPRTGTGLP